MRDTYYDTRHKVLRYLRKTEVSEMLDDNLV